MYIHFYWIVYKLSFLCHLVQHAYQSNSATTCYHAASCIWQRRPGSLLLLVRSLTLSLSLSLALALWGMLLGGPK